MKKDGPQMDTFFKLFEIIKEFICIGDGQNSIMGNKINQMATSFYNFFTGFPQILWKNRQTFSALKILILVLVVSLSASCTYFKGSKEKSRSPMENAMMSMTEEEVKKRLGEPTIVSITPDKKIIWTYKPDWKIMPDNKDTIYVEFEDGKVVKVIKAK